MGFEFERPTNEEELEHLLGRIYDLAKRGSYVDALKACDVLIEEAATKKAGLRERAAVKEHSGDIAGAVMDLAELIASGSVEPADFHQLGVWTLCTGSAHDAVDYLSKALQLGERAGFHAYTNSSYLHRAEAHLRLGNLAEAFADCAKLPEGYKTYVEGVGMRSKEQIQQEADSRSR
jgi:tetratricopeptide (TPR) repeat protein